MSTVLYNYFFGSPPGSGNILEIADETTGSSDPTYRGSNKRVALTAAKRRLLVTGKHSDGVQLTWVDHGSSIYSRVTRGSITDGRILSGQGSGDIHAAIAVGTDSGGNEIAVVVCSGPASTSTRALEARRLTDLDSPLGPVVGALVVLDTGGANNGSSKADIGKERTAGGVERLCVAYLKTVSATPTYELRAAWITDLTTDTLALSTTTSITAAGLTSGSRHANVVEKPAENYNGLGLISRGSATSATRLKLFQRAESDSLTTWAESTAQGEITNSASYSNGVRLGSEWITCGATDVTNGIVVVERFNNDGTARTLDLTTPAGYFDPVIVTDGTRAYVIMRTGTVSVDMLLVSRMYTPGLGWTSNDEIELSGRGGDHTDPNALRDSSRINGILFLAPATGASASQTKVLVVERAT